MTKYLTLLSAAIIGLALSASAAPPSDSIFALDPAKVASSQSSADHEAFAKAFEDEAAALDKKVAFHQNLADQYAAPGGKSVQAAIARHCRELAKEYKAAAEENRQLAAAHKKLAKSAAK